MKWTARAAACLALVAVCIVPCGRAGATAYTTFHFDNARDGWNANETRLTQASVSHLSNILDIPLDGEVDAQPLYANGVAYIVTENDTLYAVSPRRGVLWTRSFGTPVGTREVGNCLATSPTIGIEGTPAIDSATKALYLVSFTLVASRPTYTLHAVSLLDGHDLRAAGISRFVVVPSAHRERAALLDDGGVLYVAFAGFCDHQAAVSYGRVLAFSASNLSLQHAFVTTASPRCGSFHLGTIWGLGFGPAAGAHGIYFSTGNGCIDYSTTQNGGYGDAVLRLTNGLQLESTRTALFAPCRALVENAHDEEMGSGGVLFAPGTRFLIAGGKTGITYVLDPNDLGGYHPGCPDRVIYETTTSWGIWGGPVAWRSRTHSYVAVAGLGPHGIRVYEINRATGVLRLLSETGVRLYNGGESLIVTSDAFGTPATTVLWALTRPTTGAVYLDAYDPYDLKHPLFSAIAGAWGNPNGYSGVSPTVADGMVFVATNERLTVWSLDRASRKPWTLWIYIAAALLAVGAGMFLRRQ